MTTFQNENEVYNQAGIQTNHGPMHNGPTYYGEVHITHHHEAPVARIVDYDEAAGKVRSDDEILESFAFPEMFERRDNIDRAHPETCSWILEHDIFQTWAAQTNGLLWIKGKPGSGKSTIMAYLYNAFRRQRTDKVTAEIYLDFFFSARGKELQRTLVGMLRSIINQLFQQSAHVRPAIQKAYEEKCTAFGKLKLTWDWSLDELKTIFDRAIDDASQDTVVNIFVDALDEAGDHAAREAAEIFHLINDRAVNSDHMRVKTCISCRHYPIVSALPGSEIYVEDNNLRDISKFINDRLDGRTAAIKSQEDADSRRELNEVLLRSSAGVFQWVHLMVPLVQGYLWDGETAANIVSRLRQLPKELNSLYEYIILDVIKPEYHAQSFLLFQWVCLADRPLSVTQLRYAMSSKDAYQDKMPITCHETKNFITSDQRMKSCITSWSGGLLEAVETAGHLSPPVQVIHQSVRDYILSHGFQVMCNWSGRDPDFIGGSDTSTITKNKNALSQCHRNLMQCCINYVATEHLENSLEQELWNEHQFDREAILDSAHPFVARAAQTLFDYAGKVTDWKEGEVETTIEGLQNIFLRWQKFWWLLHWPVEPESDSCPTTLLHRVCSANWISALLIMSTDDLHTADISGNDPLHIAAYYGHVEVTEKLLEFGASVERVNGLGRTPLDVAAACGHAALARRLIEHGKSHDRGRKDYLREALLQAVAKEQFLIIRLLLDSGVDIDQIGMEGMRAVEVASFSGLLQPLRMLIEAGAGIHLEGGRYGNAIQAAFYRQVTIEDPDTLERRSAWDTDCLQLLLDAGGDLDRLDEYGTTALCTAILDSRTEAAQLMLYLGANPNAKSKGKRRPIHFAAQLGCNDVLAQLLAMGADPNAKDTFGKTALHFTVRTGNTVGTQMLLDSGADLTVSDRYSCTPLDLIMANQQIFRLIISDLLAFEDKRKCFWKKIRPTQIKCKIRNLQHVIEDLAYDLRDTSPRNIYPGFFELGHCLIQLGDLQQGTRALLHAAEGPYVLRRLFEICSFCFRRLYEIFHVCTICPGVNICTKCAIQPVRMCADHSMLCVDTTEAWEDAEMLDRWSVEWLYDVVDKYGALLSNSKPLTIYERFGTDTKIPIMVKKIIPLISVEAAAAATVTASSSASSPLSQPEKNLATIDTNDLLSPTRPRSSIGRGRVSTPAKTNGTNPGRPASSSPVSRARSNSSLSQPSSPRRKAPQNPVSTTRTESPLLNDPRPHWQPPNRILPIPGSKIPLPCRSRRFHFPFFDPMDHSNQKLIVRRKGRRVNVDQFDKIRERRRLSLLF